jgi:glycosyltransferase involved in cell wall biosynthesis
MDRIPKSQFLLILSRRPEGGYNDAIRIARGLNLNGQLTLSDPVPRDELPSYIAAADCVVVPSLSEGFGFTAAEACAMERPLVASDVASLPEVVSGKYVLVEPRSPAAIADAVEMVYKGEVDSHPKKRFSWDDCVDHYLHVYKEFLA